MINFRIILDGCAPVKKNERSSSYTRLDKTTGVRMPLSFPVSYYSKAYNTWAATAVQRVIAWKALAAKELIFPLSGEYVVSMFFFRDRLGVVDLQNLYDSVLDIFAGNSGLKFSKSSNIEHSDYQIIQDDSFKYIKNHGASFILYDKVKPRTEVFVSDFKIHYIKDIMKLCHPDLELSDQSEPKQIALFEKSDNSLFNNL